MGKPKIFVTLIFSILLIEKSSIADVRSTNTLQADREMIRSMVAYYLDGQEYDQAQTSLIAHLQKDMTDAEGWKLLGLVFSKTEKWTESKMALEKAVSHSSGFERGANLYLLADAQFRSGNEKEGREILASLRNIPGFKEPVESARLAISRMSPIPPLDLSRISAAYQSEIDAAENSPWKPLHVLFTLTSGYDTNALIIPDSVISTGQIPPASPFFTPSLQFTYVTELLKSPIFMALNTGYTFNTSPSANGLNNLPVSFSTEWKIPGSLGVTFTNVASVAFANSSPFSLFTYGDTLGFRKSIFSKPWGKLDVALQGGYSWYPGVTPSTSRDLRDGPIASPNIRFKHRMGSFEFVEVLGYQHTFAAGENFQSDGFNILVSGTRSLFFGWSGQSAISYTLTNYPLNSQGRRDNKWNLGLEVSKRINLGIPVQTGIAYGFEENFSTLSLANYSKHNISLKVSYEIR